MFVSMNWIREYVDLEGLDLEELIHRFTLSTAEVEDIYYKGNDVRGVVAGRIASVEAHPESKKLHLLKVDAGQPELVDIVCGAPNVREGMLVPVALAGGRVPAMEIKETVIAGYPSKGMCCAEDELGISDDHAGLMELEDDVPVGTDLTSVYGIRDVIFEVDNKSLTNRPDLWGHYGIAREFAAITGRPLKPLALDESEYDGEEIPVTVGTDLLYRYSALKIQNIGRQTAPVDMRIRLYYCGMRSINLLADLTNYLMLEMGQPMHAFDANKISAIGIATPREALTFTTLDGTERQVDENTIMIYDGDAPVAIAGIMGGLDSEIVDGTTSVVLESANFDGISVRKSSSRLGLRTDASMRYEKILDPEMTVTAIRRFVKLLRDAEPAATVVSKLADVYPKHYDAVELSFDKKYVDRYTGIDISDEQIVKTLTALGFGVKLENEIFTVDVPTWRATKDVTIKADIIEEITRIYGYDNFAITTTRSALHPVRAEVYKTEEALIKDILVNKFNLHEVHSYIWCDGKKFKRLGLDVEENVRILNIPTPENGTVRNAMVPTLLTMAYENKSFADEYGIFEIGRVADGTLENGYANERKRLGVVLYSKTASEKALYFRLLNALKFLFADIKHFEADFAKGAPDHAYQHPKNTAVISVDGVKLGQMFTLHPANLKKLDKHANCVCAEIFLDEFYAVPVRDVSFTEPSRFPGIDYDLSLLIRDDMRYADIRDCWESLAIPTLTGAQVVDVFDLGSLRSLTVRLTFSHPDRTLSMEEVQESVDDILAALAKKEIYLKQ